MSFFDRLKQVVRQTPKIAPLLGASMGGIAGSVLGGEFGLLGGAVGGAAGFIIEKVADRIGETEIAPSSLGPRVFGGILTDVSDFVGRKQELRSVTEFFSSSRFGVCLLFGFGGCGKSAVLKVFTSRTCLLDPPSSAKRKPAVFLWSFAQDPSLERFFVEFRRYIDPVLPKSDRLDGHSGGTSYLNLPDLIQRSGVEIVLVLDGIETVTIEDESTEARDGSLAIPALRILLQNAAAGECGKLSVFCTSRVVPPELKRPNSDSFLAIDLSAFLMEDGVALLRKKGAKGSRKSIESVVAGLKYHAYSVALMGDILREAFRGDIRQADQVLNSGNAIGSPLHSILTWYQARLDSRQLAYLQTAALFRAPATQQEVATLMPYLMVTREQNEWQLTSGDARIVAAALQGFGLIFDDVDSSTGEVVLTLHPIIREYFYQQITNVASFHREAFRIVEARLPEQADISNAHQLALLQELVFQALGSGEVELAWRIYQDRIGGYPALGYQMADHPTGTKLVDMFLKRVDALVEGLPADAVYDLHVDGALYLKNEGRLDDAIGALRRLDYLETRLVGTGDAAVSALLVLAGIELLRGKLQTSYDTVKRARKLLSDLDLSLPRSSQVRLEKEFLTRLAVVKAARGEDGLTDFLAADAIPFEVGTIPHDFGPIRHIWALGLHGKYQEAERKAVEALAYADSIGANMLKQRISCMAALSASWEGDFDRADFWSGSITDWALKADIHVAVLDRLQKGVYALRLGRLDESEKLLSEGTAFAGDSGFLLEWLDMLAVRSYVALARGRTADAVELATSVIDGRRDGYLVPLSGAGSPEVRYLWPLVAAVEIRRKCLVLASEPADSLGPSAELTRVSSSQNYLLRAVRDL